MILKIEFLHPSKDDEHHVILLVVTSEKTKTRIRCYEWDSSTHVSEAVELGNGQRVSDDQQLPLLLIPLTMSTAFLLVFEDRIVTYTGVLHRPATSHVHWLDHMEGPEEPGSSRAKPVFTQWARAMRREDHVSKQDNIFLCREDGVVRFLDISEEREIPHMLDSSHKAGRLKVNVNTAFASLDLGIQFHDLLVAGGDMSDGGLWTFEPRRVPTKPMAKFPNWTPTIDFVAADTAGRSATVSKIEIFLALAPEHEACAWSFFDRITEKRIANFNVGPGWCSETSETYLRTYRARFDPWCDHRDSLRYPCSLAPSPTRDRTRLGSNVGIA